MPNIYARSPYIVSIDEASQIRTKIEIYMWNTGSTIPTTPNYTLSKYIPSSNVTETVYNISPYLREYITHTYPQTTYTNTATSSEAYVNYTIKRYKDIGSGFVLIDLIEGLAYDGYTEYSNGANYENSFIALKEEGTYYYYYPSDVNIPNVIVLCDGGFNVYNVKWTPLEGGGTSQYIDLSAEDKPVTVAGFNMSNIAYKNKFEILDSDGNVKATYYFYPITECKYTPLRVDYINKYGAWDKIWFFKASNNTITTSSKTYNNNPGEWDYNVKVGTTSIYNKTGREKIRLNSGFVEESVNSQIRQLMLSERVLVDGKPVVLKTDSVELFKHINQKQINYTMEFEYAYDLVNNVI